MEMVLGSIEGADEKAVLVVGTAIVDASNASAIRVDEGGTDLQAWNLLTMRVRSIVYPRELSRRVKGDAWSGLTLIRLIAVPQKEGQPDPR